MSKKITLVVLLALFFVSLLGCSNGAEQSSRERIEYLKDPRFGYISITYLNPEEELIYYKESLEECNKIMMSYLGDDYEEAEIIPISVGEMQNGGNPPRGFQINGVIYLNLNYENDMEMVTTLVHEELHYQNPNGIHVKGLEEEDNVTLTEYIVYNLSEKVCCAYDEKYSQCDYGRAPVIGELDNSLEELYDVYLGRKKMSKDLEKKIQKAFKE